MIILGIDPGSRITGYGVLSSSTGTLQYLGSGCIRLKDLQLAERLHTLYAEIHQIIALFNPNVLSIEQIFMGKNANTALKLGHARGVLMLAAAQAELSIFEYSSRQIKQSVTGYGAADKVQMQLMVASLLKVAIKPQADAADALAAAITHAYHATWKRD